MAGVCHIPDLVRCVGVGAEHVNLAVTHGQTVAVTDADYLGATARAIRDGDMKEYCGLRGFVTSTMDVPLSIADVETAETF
jgi:hypothetical protein